MRKKLFFVLTIIFTFVFCQGIVNSASYSYKDYIGTEEIPYGGSAAGYGYDDFVMYDESGALDANVPLGYSGYVLKIAQEDSGAIGFPVDLSGYLASSVKEIKFRIYCAPTTKAVRMTTNGGVNWHINTPPSATEEWIEFSFSDIKSITDANGYLKQFRFGLRNSNVSNFYLYVDYIKVVRDAKIYGFNDYMGTEEIPYGGSAKGYGYDDFIMYNQYAAEDENVPAGFSGYVLKIAQDASGAIGFPVDLSEYLASNVEEIKFRIYCAPTTKAIRMTSNGGSSWHIDKAPSATEEWIEVSYTNINSITDSDGHLKQFSFGVRNSTVGEFYLYVDSITVVTNIVEDDTQAPVISLVTDEFFVPVGTKLRIDANVTDESEKVDVNYSWSEGAVDRSGRLLEGTHTLTITAKDPSQNTSSKNVLFRVSKYDVTLTREFVCVKNAISKCKLIVACYDEKKTLVDVKCINDVVNNVRYELASLCDKTDVIKVFVWDNNEALYPLNVVQKLELKII